MRAASKVSLSRRCSSSKSRDSILSRTMIGLQLLQLIQLPRLGLGLGLGLGGSSTTLALAPNRSSPITVSRIGFSKQTRSTLFDSSDSNDGITPSSSSSSSPASDWMEKASRLRKEAEEMEASMATTERRRSPSISPKAVTARYQSLQDSSWTVSYRFASDPPPNDDDSNDNNDGKKNVPLRYYSGKISVRLRADGYTDLVTDSDSTNITDKDDTGTLVFTKLWGWDEDVSNEDGNTYLSFSADVVLPPDGKKSGSGTKTDRFYFNARVDVDASTGDLSLHDGTVTVKRDVLPRGGGGWGGLFNAGGILAQFRYCGEFIMKAR